LGVVSIAPGNSFVIADIPGLIEGAHEGVGLGHEFLKHIERTKLLVHVVDISSIEGRDPISDFEVINEELEKYNSKLIKKPQVVAANKTDICEDEANLKRFTEYVEAKGYKVFPMSAAANKGLKELMYYLAGQLKEIPDTILIDEVDQVVLYTEDESKPFEIKKEGNVFVVEGSWVRKIVGSTNLGDTESLQYFQRAIRKKGIIDALESEGINEGDTVKMYEVEFDYVR
jgi:GTP-binding protein